MVVVCSAVIEKAEYNKVYDYALGGMDSPLPRREITHTGMVTWDRRDLCEFPGTAKSVSKVPTPSRDEGPGRASCMESVLAPSTDTVFVTDDEDNAGCPVEFHEFDQSN